ncbi:aminoglycoside resistance protein [Kribbella qitaiheensis]|uniref:Aminoglycoside resistance protein n=1 Tax=Kribbella qitaiheensis TaxID=1544730 RepID=A0A7G6X619_9ACTN|nr:aminoglycoside phosphotransferase family protein [Kribbella qitaiheensis]QNE21684.1 aminoglycoside resistance protein [Kribbella qitaiheensis]
MPVEIPAEFLKVGSRGPEWVAWIDQLPRLTRDLLAEWGLRVDGEPTYGNCALVVPVRTPDGVAAMLKVQFPHWEAETEHLALRIWDGNGAIRLLRADPRRFALLLERAQPQDLTSIDEIEASETIASLYKRLHVPAGPQFKLLSSQTERWSRELLALPASAPVPRRYVEQAAALARDFASDSACDGTLIHTDLHYFNVLAADREPWLVIDPKPLSGDPHYEVAPLLWNRWDEIAAHRDLRFALRRRFYAIIDTAGLDENRARDWIIVRQMVNALGAVRDAGSDESLPMDWLTRNIAITKAIQD